jgi:hypothetical protein
VTYSFAKDQSLQVRKGIRHATDHGYGTVWVRHWAHSRSMTLDELYEGVVQIVVTGPDAVEVVE